MALGNIGASSLVKSAASVASQIATYNDAVAAQQWNNSAQTDADWQVYSEYLNGRITKLQGQGTLSGLSKATSLVNTYQSANRSYVSNTIQRATMAIIEGNGTATDKLSTIDNLYYQAVANGDMNLAQNLASQHDSLSQQIQYDQQVAATANESLVKANIAAQEKGYKDAIGAIKSEIQRLNLGFKTAGQAPLTGELKSASSNIKAIIDAANESLPDDQKIVIPSGANLNNGSLIQGALNAMGTMYGLASDIAATTPGGSSDTEDLRQKSIDIFSGVTTIKAFGRDWNLAEANEYAANPKSYITVNDENGTRVVKAKVNGISFDANGNLVKSYSTDIDTTTNKAVGNVSMANMNSNGQDESKRNRDNTKKELEAAGFTVDKIDPETGEVTVSFSKDGKNSWATDAIKQYGLNNNGTYKVIQTSSGYQLMQANDMPIVGSNGQSLLLELQRDEGGRFALINNQYNQYTKGTTGLLLGRQDGYTGSAVTGTMLVGQADQFARLNKLTTNPQVTASPQTAATVQKTGSVQNTATPAQLTNTGNLTVGKVKTPNLTVAPAPKNGNLTMGTAKTGNLTMGQVAGTDKQTALATYFSNFSKQAAGYTEKTILPQYAKQFYNGDIKAASADVYNYRKTNFGS